jgi:integrase
VMVKSPSDLPRLLKAKGRSMPRRRYQRPTVHLWVSKGGEKFWKAEWKVYIEGRPKPKHRAKTWPCREFTKSKAQELCDQLVREETGSTARPDGSMLVRDFWTKVFYPIAERRLALNSKANYESAWRVHIQPAIGRQELQHVVKHAIEAMLGHMADADHGQATLKRVLMLVHELFEEALANGYIVRNPARKIVLPKCRAIQETTALTEQQVRTIFEATEGRDRLMWRILLLTGCRPGEMLALQKSDLVPAGLLIDESTTWGRPDPTKNRKQRIAPLPAALRQELSEWCRGVEGHLMFPSPRGKLLRLSSDEIRGMLERARKVVSKLTFRQCRTTFATLYEGDSKDRQAILGHHSEQFTMAVYRKAIAPRQQASVEELEARLGGKVVEMPKKERSA